MAFRGAYERLISGSIWGYPDLVLNSGIQKIVWIISEMRKRHQFEGVKSTEMGQFRGGKKPENGTVSTLLWYTGILSYHRDKAGRFHERVLCKDGTVSTVESGTVSKYIIRDSFEGVKSLKMGQFRLFHRFYSIQCDESRVSL